RVGTEHAHLPQDQSDRARRHPGDAHDRQKLRVELSSLLSHESPSSSSNLCARRVYPCVAFNFFQSGRHFSNSGIRLLRNEWITASDAARSRIPVMASFFA